MLNQVFLFLPGITGWTQRVELANVSPKGLYHCIRGWFKLESSSKICVADNCNQNINIGVGPRAAARLVISISDVKILNIYY